MRGFLGIVALFCIVNLVPFLLGGLLYFSQDGTISQSIVIAVKSLFEIPSSVIWFIVQAELGNTVWIITNIIVLFGCIVTISKI